MPRPLGISSLASRQLISACQRAITPSARPTLGGFPTWPVDGAGCRAHSGHWSCHRPLAAPPPPRVFPQYLLSMVVEYFGRVGLPGHLYNRIHFFLAL